MVYKVVMKLVEGMILIVVKDVVKKVVVLVKEEIDIIVVMEIVIEEVEVLLNCMLDLLFVLKDVGVVDSGGKGLFCVYEGFLVFLKGEFVLKKVVFLVLDDMVNVEYYKSVQSMLSIEDIEFGFCMEVMVRLD